MKENNHFLSWKQSQTVIFSRSGIASPFIQALRAPRGFQQTQAGVPVTQSAGGGSPLPLSPRLLSVGWEARPRHGADVVLTEAKSRAGPGLASLPGRGGRESLPETSRLCPPSARRELSPPRPAPESVLCSEDAATVSSGRARSTMVMTAVPTSEAVRGLGTLRTGALVQAAAWSEQAGRGRRPRRER